MLQREKNTVKFLLNLLIEKLSTPSVKLTHSRNSNSGTTMWDVFNCSQRVGEIFYIGEIPNVEPYEAYYRNADNTVVRSHRVESLDAGLEWIESQVKAA